MEQTQKMKSFNLHGQELFLQHIESVTPISQVGKEFIFFVCMSSGARHEYHNQSEERVAGVRHKLVKELEEFWQ